MMNFKKLCETVQAREPRLTVYDIRYRIVKHNLGKHLGSRFNLYSEKDVRIIVNSPIRK